MSSRQPKLSFEQFELANSPSPGLSPKNNQYKQPLTNLITSITKQQHHTFYNLSQKCSTMEYSIATIEVFLTQLSEKIIKVNQHKEVETLSSLKMKQSEFIIGELKNTLAKQVKKQQRITEDFQGEKKKSQKYREQIYRLQIKNTGLIQKTNNLQLSIKQKNTQILSLNNTLSKLKNQMSNHNKIQTYASSQQYNRNQQYLQLQLKLQELQTQLSSQIQKLNQKNLDLQSINTKSKRDYSDLQLKNKEFRKENQQLKRLKYQLQLKVKQETSLIVELQQSYKKIVQKNNLNQISLHKQIQEYKIRENYIKIQYKKEKKVFKTYLNAIADYSNGNKYYLTSSNMKDQVQEIKKLIDKNIKKKVENYHREVQYYQGQVSTLKNKLEESQNKINKIIKDKSKVFSEKDTEKLDISDRGEKNSENSIINKSDDQKNKFIQQKYKSKLQQLRKELKAKHIKISQLQKQQQIDFDKNKQNLLLLQTELSQKDNIIYKLNINMKQKQYLINQLKKNLKQLENKMMVNNQKIESQKKSNVKIVELKIQAFQQKIKILKNSYKQLQKKQQQKTIKYNKLKTKLQKYEVQVNQSLKRKNTQLDQLLKQNNKMKIDNKLLQQKININNIIQNQINKNKTPNQIVINNDLIEQIQMERDRISNKLSEKEKQCQELISLNSKLNMDFLGIKKEVKDGKIKIQEISRQQKMGKQQNFILKEKLQNAQKELQEQSEQKYSYMKKQLQKSMAGLKKLQRANQKLKQQRQNLKRIYQQRLSEKQKQKDKQILTLKKSLQKGKDQIRKLSSELSQFKDTDKKKEIDYQRRISQHLNKEEQLITIINYKNRQINTNDIRQSMKGEELILSEQRNLQISKETMTNVITWSSVYVNTDPIVISQDIQDNYKPIVPSEMLLQEYFKNQDDDLQDFSLGNHEKAMIQQRNPLQAINKQQNLPKLTTYFNDLIDQQNQDDNFEIYDENDEVNIKISASNLQIKEFFNEIRRVIQKILNEQDISLNIIALPKQLQDDFQQFMSYIKQKICQIKNQNNLTFIMAQVGDQPESESIQVELLQFLNKQSVEYIQLKRIINEKEQMISSLMNQKTQQENTITQQQTIQEQGEKLHVMQYSILKNEITEQKLSIDKQQLYYESLKNIIKKMMVFWIDDDDNYDDFKDNLYLFRSIYNFNKKEVETIDGYLKKYKELKHIQ